MLKSKHRPIRVIPVHGPIPSATGSWAHLSNTVPLAHPNDTGPLTHHSATFLLYLLIVNVNIADVQLTWWFKINQSFSAL